MLSFREFLEANADCTQRSPSSLLAASHLLRSSFELTNPILRPSILTPSIRHALAGKFAFAGAGANCDLFTCPALPSPMRICEFVNEPTALIAARADPHPAKGKRDKVNASARANSVALQLG